MAKKLTAKQMHARYEALNEAAEHLLMTWTDNPVESAEGLVMSDWLKEQARKWLERATTSHESN